MSTSVCHLCPKVIDILDYSYTIQHTYDDQERDTNFKR